MPDARGEARCARHPGAGREPPAADDLVIFLVSGGGSALTPAPAPPITLEEKQALTRLLLAAGATINELNAVRKHLSRFKGGQLARAAAPAPVRPLAALRRHRRSARRHRLGPDRARPDRPSPMRSASCARRDVRDHRARRPSWRGSQPGARGEIAETPKPGDPHLRSASTNLVIGNNALVADAAAAARPRARLSPPRAHALARGRGSRGRARASSPGRAPALRGARRPA